MARARVRNPLTDPVRVAMLRGTGLLGTTQEEAFDRLAGLTRKVLKAPTAMITLVDDTHLHAKSCAGQRDLVKNGRTPVKETFCQHVVRSGEPLVVEDAREHELTKGLAAVKSGKALAYAGVPLTLHGGFVVGTLCVVDAKPRAWKRDDVSILEDLAQSVLTEIEMRADIEARKQAESDLQRSTARLRGLMDNSPTVIFAKDLEGRYLFLNHAGERLLGITEAEAIGKTDAELHPPELAAALREHDAAVVAAGEPLEIEETLALGGRTAVYRSVKFPLTDLAGEPYGICGISTDITERKQTEARAARGAAALRQRVRERPDRDGDGRHRRALPPGQRGALRADRPQRGRAAEAHARRHDPSRGVGGAQAAVRAHADRRDPHPPDAGALPHPRRRGALGARQRHRADRRRGVAERVLRPVPGHHRADPRPAAARRPPRRHARARAGRAPSSRRRRCCSRRSAPTSAGRSARCGSSTTTASCPPPPGATAASRARSASSTSRSASTTCPCASRTPASRCGPRR